MSPPLASWIVVAVALILAETPVVYLLRRIAPEICLGAVYLVGVLVVSSVWGLALGVVTAVLSVAAFGFLYVASALYFVGSDPRGPVALTIVLAVAVELCSVAAPARLRSIGADERRGDADPAAMMARLLLRTDDLRCALPGGGTLLVPADLPQTTQRRVRERVVASVEALLGVARDREGMGSVVER